jgi:hypothetical protein
MKVAGKKKVAFASKPAAMLKPVVASKLDAALKVVAASKAPTAPKGVAVLKIASSAESYCGAEGCCCIEDHHCEGYYPYNAEDCH